MYQHLSEFTFTDTEIEINYRIYLEGCFENYMFSTNFGAISKHKKIADFFIYFILFNT